MDEPLRMGVSLAASETPSWQSGGKHPWRYEKRGRDDIVYFCTTPRGVDLVSNQVFDQGTGVF